MPRVTDARFCCDCLTDGDDLVPFRPHWLPKKAATPKYCPQHLPKKRRSRFEDPVTGQIDAQKWAEHQYAVVAAEAYARHRHREAYRGMLRTEPWPPQGRVPSFVWELKATHSLVTEYARGFRYAKTDW